MGNILLYFWLTTRMLAARRSGMEDQEDLLLDRLDQVWFRMSEDEIALVERIMKCRGKLIQLLRI